MPAAAAQGVGRRVVGDGEQPGGELRADHVLLAGAIHAEEDLLGQVFSRVVVAHQMFEHADQSCLIAQHQLLEGRSAIVADFEHQPHVRI